jgi:hypothetical protein
MLLPDNTQGAVELAPQGKETTVALQVTTTLPTVRAVAVVEQVQLEIALAQTVKLAQAASVQFGTELTTQVVEVELETAPTALVLAV